jgi:hypothetical protein
MFRFAQHDTTLLPSFKTFVILERQRRNRDILYIMAFYEPKKEEITGQNLKAVIYFINNNIKLFYLYFTINKCAKKKRKISQIVSKMDYLYV